MRPLGFLGGRPLGGDAVKLLKALSALRDYRRKAGGRSTSAPRRDPRRFSVDTLVAAARADRVYSVLRPYLEALA